MSRHDLRKVERINLQTIITFRRSETKARPGKMTLHDLRKVEHAELFAYSDGVQKTQVLSL